MAVLCVLCVLCIDLPDLQLAGELISYPNILYLLRTKSLTRSDLRNDRSREVSVAIRGYLELGFTLSTYPRLYRS